MTTGACAGTQPVVSESYDEVLFTGPSPAFAGLLAKRRPGHVPGPNPHAQYWNKFDDTDDLEAIRAARRFVAREMEGTLLLLRAAWATVRHSHLGGCSTRQTSRPGCLKRRDKFMSTSRTSLGSGEQPYERVHGRPYLVLCACLGAPAPAGREQQRRGRALCEAAMLWRDYQRALCAYAGIGSMRV